MSNRARFIATELERRYGAETVARWLAAFTVFEMEGGNVADDIDRLADLLDVLLSNPQVGDTLQFDGTKWINKAEFESTSLILQATSVDVSLLGNQAHCKWDYAADNFWDFNTLSALPSGIGLNVAFDGSSSVISIIEDGTWTFSFRIQRLSGASKIILLDGLGFFNQIDLQLDENLNVWSGTMKLPSGSSIDPFVENISGDEPGAAVRILTSIVRLG